MSEFVIRKAVVEDISALKSITEKVSMEYGYGYFNRSFDEANHKKRIIIITEDSASKEVLGYAQLIWLPIYSPFRRFKIPEIQDLNVIADARCRGIGSAMIDYLEDEVKKAGFPEIGIGVGVIAKFGSAQKLYVKKGYIPDGMGVCYDEEMIDDVAMKPIDELLSIKLIKKF